MLTDPGAPVAEFTSTASLSGWNNLFDRVSGNVVTIIAAAIAGIATIIGAYITGILGTRSADRQKLDSERGQKSG